MQRENGFFAPLLITVLLASVAVPGPVQGQGSVNLPRTGQMRIGGDDAPLADGIVRAGLPLLPQRFVDNGDGSSTDTMTGLVWLQDVNLMATRNPDFDTDDFPGDGFVVWSRALEYVAALNAQSYLGHSDWRLPNIVEYETLENLDSFNLLGWLRGSGGSQEQSIGQVFSNVTVAMWTSTTVAGDSAMAWRYITLPGRPVETDKLSPTAVTWAVRGTADGPTRPWKSGQVVSYLAGDDGDLGAGVSAPTPRFVDHGDGTVTDGLTGLMWTRDANGPGPETCMPDQFFRALVWYKNATNPTLDNIQDYVLCLNDIDYLGYADWRVPNRHEMRSLIDHGEQQPALPAGHPFVNVNSDFYWTASDFFDDNQTLSDQAWIIRLASGEFQGDNKLISRRVWPVRGGIEGTSSAALTDPDPVTGPMLSFPDTPVDEAVTKRLTVSSTGQSPLVIGQIALENASDANYAICQDSCSNTILQPQGQCTVDIRMTPTTDTLLINALLLPTSAEETFTQRLNLNGNGLPSTLIFLNGFEAPQMDGCG